MTNATRQSRREKVGFYLVKHVPETEIAQMLNVSRATIVRDVAYLKKSAQSWLDGLARDGFVAEYRLALEQVKDHGFEMQRLLVSCSDPGLKRQLLRDLDENSERYVRLLADGPTVIAFRQAMKLKEEQNVRVS